MRGGLINNPKKELTVNFSSEKVIKCLKVIHLMSTEKYVRRFRFVSFDEVYQTVKLSRKGPIDIMDTHCFDINVKHIDDNKSKIDIEATRSFGAYNHEAELMVCNDMIAELLSILSQLLKEIRVSI